MKKQDKQKAIAIKNLTYCRLKADLAAVEMEIAGNQPVVSEAEKNFFKNVWNILKTGVKNELRKTTLEDLKKQFATAEAELARFESEHNAKELALLRDLASLKAFLAKKLFKKDEYGLDKLQFSLALLLDDRYAYQRPEHSLCILSDLLFNDGGYMQELYNALCHNYKYIRNDWSITVNDLLSRMPSFGNVSVQSWINKSKQRKFNARVEKLTADQAATLFAMKLTVVEKAKGILPKEEWEKLTDDTLKFIQDVRADAECEKVFTEQDDGVFEEIFSLCSLAVNRLAKVAKE